MRFPLKKRGKIRFYFPDPRERDRISGPEMAGNDVEEEANQSARLELSRPTKMVV
jgi:hypothetical protein